MDWFAFPPFLFILFCLVGFLMDIIKNNQRRCSSIYYYKKLHKEVLKIISNLEKGKCRDTNCYSNEIVKIVSKDLEIPKGYKIEEYYSYLTIFRKN